MNEMDHNMGKKNVMMNSGKWGFSHSMILVQVV
jgi:hypothetical protein